MKGNVMLPYRSEFLQTKTENHKVFTGGRKSLIMSSTHLPGGVITKLTWSNLNQLESTLKSTFGAAGNIVNTADGITEAR